MNLNNPLSKNNKLLAANNGPSLKPSSEIISRIDRIQPGMTYGDVLRFLFVLWLSIYCVDLYAAPAEKQINTLDFEVSFRFDLGSDDGTSLGTIFEVKDQNGAILSGAGFERSFNTKAGSNHRLISFFSRREGKSELVDLGQPFNEYSSVRLYSYAGRLIAYPYEAEGKPVQYDDTLGKWRPADLPQLVDGKFGHIGAIQAVKDSLLVFHARAVTFDGEPVSIDQIGKSDTIVSGLYHKEHLHIFKIDDTTKSASYLNCRWVAGNPKTACDALPMPPSWANPYVIHGLRNAPGIIAAFDNGDTVILDNGTVQTIYNNSGPGGQRQTSWQLYSSLEWQDDLLLGHYPSGNLFLFRDGKISPMTPSVPYVAESLPAAREAQSLAIFRGQVIIGMWPWGELWSGRPEAPWQLEARVFENPNYSGEEAPYADRLTKLYPALAFNALGQRVFHFANHAEGLALTTSGKHHRLRQAYASLDSSERMQYGRVLLLKSPDQLACPISGPWPQTLTFQSRNGWLRIRGANGVLCERKMEGEPPESTTGQLVPLKGIWGPASNKIRAVD